MDPAGRILPDFLAYADYVLTELYQEESNKKTNIYEIDEEIYCSYLKCQFLKGKIDKGTLLKKYFDYCEQVLDYATKASLVFDIGKISLIDYVGKVSRKLSAYEKNKIFLHPQVGADFIEKNAELNTYRDVVLGHHKSFDGESGYPHDFDATDSEVRFIIEVIKFCDWMNNETGTNKKYEHEIKSFDEFMTQTVKEMGTFFQLELIQFIQTDEELKKRLRNDCSVGRGDIYKKIYRDYLSTETSLDELYKDSVKSVNGNEIDGEIRIETVLELIDFLLKKDIASDDEKALYMLRSNVKVKANDRKSLHVHVTFTE